MTSVLTGSAPPVRSLKDLYRDLPPEVQRVIGHVEWPQPHAILDIVDSIRTGTIMGVSDGSVRTTKNRASHAWILHAPNGSKLIGRGPVDGISETRTSHRVELQGQTALFLALSLIIQFYQIIGGKLTTFCDNMSVVNKLKNGWQQWRYKHTKVPDGDLQALLHETLKHLKRSSGLSYNTEWVKAHQDDDNPDLCSFPGEVALNVRMDSETKEAYLLPLHMPALPQKLRNQCSRLLLYSSRCSQTT